MEGRIMSRKHLVPTAVALVLVSLLGCGAGNPVVPDDATVTLSYSINRGQHVLLRIFSGSKEVRRLIDESQSAGRYKVQWDLTDNAGEKVRTGTTFRAVMELETGNRVESPTFKIGPDGQVMLLPTEETASVVRITP